MQRQVPPLSSDSPRIIRTPDQRLRVFISSTITELADERAAAREAIAQLHLIPVFFEAGARPHPPRDLYSAYLEQSHIFVGIYWNSYGWLAPGVEISGLEDEYQLSTGKPRLIYVKRSDERQPRLGQLLADIERSDTVSYQQFTDAAELGRLIENDLSVLLSETFESAIQHRRPPLARPTAAPVPSTRRLELPELRVAMIGRDADLDRVAALVSRPDVGVVTLLGAGGTGKTTLAAHVAHRVQPSFADGAVFVPLGAVTDPRLVGAAIATAIGLQDTGRQPIEVTVTEFLADKQMLLVLDNFEQLTESSRLVSDIAGRAPGVRILVTSRTSLHLRGEHIYHLAPLAAPPEGARVSAGDLARYPATALFLERAGAVSRSFDTTPENVDAIVQICQRLDGLPLAIELAAARTRFFQPAALMSRIDRALDLVSKGHRDLPQRQQTLRAAIDWSYNLLSDDLRTAFRQLGVFGRSWTLEAADAVLGGATGVDIEEITERLLDVSLIQPVPVGHTAEPRFTMLQTVREYADETLLAAPEGEVTVLRHADYFRRLCLDAEPHLWSATAEPWLDKLELEYQNIRVAFYAYVHRRRIAEASDMIAPMARYWAVRGGFTEGADWVAAAGLDTFDGSDLPETGASRARAGKSLLCAGFVRMQLLQLDAGFRLLDRAEALLRGGDDDVSLAFALNMLGTYGAFVGRENAEAKLIEVAELARRLPDPLPLLYYLTWSAEFYRRRGDRETLVRNLDEATRLASDGEHLHVLGNLHLIRFGLSLLQDPIDLDRMSKDADALLRRLPAKGYKSVKGAAWHGLALSRLLRGELDEGWSFLRHGLECAREHGEPEGQFFATLAASFYYGRRGHRDLALTLFGAADQFIASTKLPMFPMVVRQYEMARAAAVPAGCVVEHEPAWQEGRKLRIDEAVMLAQGEHGAAPR